LNQKSSEQIKAIRCGTAFINSYHRNVEQKHFNISDIFCPPVILSQPDRRRREDAVEGPREWFLCHAVSGSSHETLVNSFVSVCIAIRKIVLSLRRILSRPWLHFSPFNVFLRDLCFFSVLRGD